MDHQIVEHTVFRNRGIRLGRIVFENDLAFAGDHFVGQHLPVVAIGTVEVVAPITFGDLVVVGHKNRARDAPIRGIGRLARLAFAFAVIGPVAGQPLRKQKIRRQRMKIALAHQGNALGKRRHYRADNFRPRLLVRFVKMPASNGKIACVRHRHLVAVIRKINVVRGLALPDREDHIDAFREHLVAVLIDIA